LYSKVDVSRVFGDFSRNVANKKNICYAEMYLDHQREKSQFGILDRFYPGTEIIKDIRSGRNFKRKKLSPFGPSLFRKGQKKLLSCTMTDCEDLVLDLSDSGLDFLKCAKRLLEGLWFTVKLTNRSKQLFFDHGARTFCTGYDLDMIIMKVGKSDISRNDKLCYHYDKLQSK
jgi:hypothetical protein